MVGWADEEIALEPSEEVINLDNLDLGW